MTIAHLFERVKRKLTSFLLISVDTTRNGLYHGGERTQDGGGDAYEFRKTGPGETDPNTLFQDSFRAGGEVLSQAERQLLERYRALPPAGRETLRSVSEALCAFRDEMARAPEEEPRVIPLYRSPAAAGYAAPVFGEDFDYLTVQGDVPPAAEFAVRIQGDSMEPFLRDGGVAYVNHDPLRSGDAGIFCVDGEMFCKQYYRDPLGMVYLFSLNRKRADADILLPPESGRSLVCLGRVMLHTMPLPGKDEA